MLKKCLPFLSLLLVGCNSSPSIGVLGAYFPSWLFCIAGGVFLATITQQMLSKHNLSNYITWPSLTYLAITTSYSMLIWILIFKI